MSDFYTNIAATASRLIAEYGKPITIKRTTAGAYNAITGVTTAGTTATFTPQGIFQTIKSELIDGTLIQRGDKMFIIDNSFSPLMSDKVTISSQDWDIVNIREVEPAGTALVTFVQVRK